MNKENVVSTYSDIIQTSKKRNLAVCYLDDVIAKSNKPDSEGQILHNHTCMRNLKVKLVEAKRMVVARPRSWLNGEFLLNGCKMSVFHINRF